MTGKYLYIALLFYCTSCTVSRKASADINKKLPPEKLQQDLVVLKKVLEANHPSLYWYTPKDSLDIYFNEAFNSINDSLTELQFKNKVAWFVSKIRCGHTSVRPSKTFAAHASKTRRQMFPLYLKAWSDSLVVLNNLNRNDSTIKRGTIITSIDGRSNRELLDSMFQFISTDGYADNFKNQVISFNFPLYYSFAFPLKDSFALNYIDSAGEQKFAFVKLYRPESDTLSEEEILAPGIRPPTRKEKKQITLLSKRSMTQDTASHFAYMRISTFASGRLRSFFKQSFKRLKYDSIPNLIIDLRENSGGSIVTSTKLSRYIKDKPFIIADTVAAVNRSLTYGKYITFAWPYRIAMRFTTRKKSDEKFHFTSLEHHEHKPYRKLHYNGNVYVLQGGFTFSAAAMFVLNVKGQPNVKIVGEETGGGNYGTSAIHLPSVVLPNSKVEVVLPLYRIVSNCHVAKNGRGIEPDIEVEPSSFYIRQGIDKKLDFVKEMIRQNEHHQPFVQH